MIKKYFRENPRSETALILLILSAEFGLITSGTAIPYYAANDLENEPQSFETRFSHNGKNLYSKPRAFDKVFLNAGRDYTPALEFINFGDFGHAEFAAGGIGTRLGQLKHWLSDDLPE